MRGPFTGRVLDAGTGRPIAGAIVYATWTVQSGHGLTAPGGFREHVTSTDADGRYKVPRVSKVPESASSRITDFYIVVYKRGYVAYRSDRRFADLGPRMDFAQGHNKIELERWRTDLSHAKHLRFIGGGSAIAALTAWEVEEAARELSGGAGSLSTDPFAAGGDGAAAAVVAARLLTPEDVKGVTGYDGEFERGPLGDDPDTAQYSSLHLRALDRPESFDVALRLWKVDAAQAQSRYGQLLDTLPTAEQTDEIADRSLRASEGDIRGLAFLDGKRGAVVLITCGAAQCRSPEDVVELGKIVHERLEAIWPMGATR